MSFHTSVVHAGELYYTQPARLLGSQLQPLHSIAAHSCTAESCYLDLGYDATVLH